MLCDDNVLTRVSISQSGVGLRGKTPSFSFWKTGERFTAFSHR
jgi:hypothetical protein